MKYIFIFRLLVKEETHEYEEKFSVFSGQRSVYQYHTEVLF